MFASIKRMFSSTTSPEAQAAVKTLVDEAIASSKIVVFSKTYCPYCVSAKATLQGQKGLKVLELDQRQDGSDVQTYLAEKLGVSRVTVPQIWISGKAIGGNSDLQSLQKSGKLAELLK